jgi:SAM-dependent methyltransferase
MTQLPCKVCGGNHFTHHDVLWPDLVTQWGLSPCEAQYINVQQGTSCTQCGANIRSIALADAILRYAHVSSNLTEWAAGDAAHSFSLLEINEAGSLSSVLRKLAGHRLIQYPEYNMMALPFESDSFDLVVHSDTLEHVPDPIQALRECRRVLRRGGACIFTVPVVLGRLTRSRKGLPVSLHGCQGGSDVSMTVHTEFGADVWCKVLDSGFDDCRIVPYRYPAGIALVAGVSERLDV